MARRPWDQRVQGWASRPWQLLSRRFAALRGRPGGQWAWPHMGRSLTREHRAHTRGRAPTRIRQLCDGSLIVNNPSNGISSES